MDMKKNICHIVNGFHVGGLEKVIVNSINSLGDNYCHTIISLTTSGSIVKQLNGTVEVINLDCKKLSSIKKHTLMYKVLKNLSPDVLHTYNLGTVEFQIVGWILGINTRLHAEHGRDINDPTGSNYKYKFIRKFCSLFTHKVVAVSHDLYDWLSSDVGISPSKVIKIVNGIDVTNFSSNEKNTDLIETNEFVIGHVARLDKIKNQKMLINGFFIACSMDDDFMANSKLIIVGDGSEKNNLLEISRSNKALSEKVSFVGEIENVKKVYMDFDVFSLTSLAEGIPMTLLESMSMGIPHVVTQVGGINEVTISGVTGLNIPSEDEDNLAAAFISLFRDKNKCYSMGEAARNRICESFSQEIMIEEYKKLYN
ncbi:glycosyltransferase [Photobacterium minamisatsumaniensis]|uniref:glycosyltransferase n=1 Tax=Photobacterium minamisatsumaniensis TaxID=2910233 RepID=UPI003D09827E